jgi:predicted DNA-binding transcriptional regulator YafY
MGEDICSYNVVSKKYYYIASRTFELAELKLLADSVQSSKFITQKKSAELIKKIESLASAHDAKEIDRQIYVTGKVKTMNESIYYTVDTIHSAMSAAKAINFQYFDYDENKNKILRHDGKIYTVSPWALISNEDNYYLRAFDHEKNTLKNFRVDKMSAVEISKDSRLGKEVYEKTDPEKYTQRTFGMYGECEMLVALEFHRSLCGVMIDRFGKDVTFFKTADPDMIRITVNVNVGPNFFGWVMCFGNRVKIISPDSVVKKITELASDTLNIYKR